MINISSEIKQILKRQLIRKISKANRCFGGRTIQLIAVAGLTDSEGQTWGDNISNRSESLRADKRAERVKERGAAVSCFVPKNRYK